MWDLIVSVPDHCLSFYFPSRIDFKTCKEEVASALGGFGSRWCGRGCVGPGALRGWKVSIFKIVDRRVGSGPGSAFRRLGRSVQEFRRKYVLVPADGAANDVVVV